MEEQECRENSYQAPTMTEGRCCKSRSCQGSRSVSCRTRLPCSRGSEGSPCGQEDSVGCMGGWRGMHKKVALGLLALPVCRSFNGLQMI